MMLRAGALAVALTMFAGTAHPALLANGDFEFAPAGAGEVVGNVFEAMPAASGAGTFDVWGTLPGWTTVTGAGIEVQTAGTLPGVAPFSGRYHVELDSDPTARDGTTTNTTMVQSVTLDPGRYQLSYAYRPRTDALDDNGLEVRFDGSVLQGHARASGDGLGWVTYFADIDVPAAGAYEFAFAATGTDNSFGALLDDVELTAVPLPASLPLLGAGLAALAYVQRRART